MVIKNKNGSEYKLRGPNPIMKEQDIWADFQLHNMQFHEEIRENSTNKQKVSKKISLGQTVVVKNEEAPVQPIKVEVPEPTPQPTVIKYDIPKIEPTPIPETEVIYRPKSISDKLQSYNKDILHCLPAKTKTITDSLYEEKTIKVTYGNQFLFEAIIIEETDFELLFWSHLEIIQKYSIIYPRNKNKRWWKAESVKNAPEGYFINCRPSDIQPSFEQDSNQ